MNFTIISPFPPYRGGISKETEVLCDSLISHNHNIKIINFKRLYPRIFFPGRTQYLEDYNRSNLIHNTRVIDTISPLSWNRAYYEIISEKTDCIIFRYWHPFFIPAYYTIAKNLKAAIILSLILIKA